jgi:hypothetical protein
LYPATQTYTHTHSTHTHTHTHTHCTCSRGDGAVGTHANTLLAYPIEEMIEREVGIKSVCDVSGFFATDLLLRCLTSLGQVNRTSEYDE